MRTSPSLFDLHSYAEVLHSVTPLALPEQVVVDVYVKDYKLYNHWVM